VLPIVVASAIQRHPQGPLALAAGVVVSPTALGFFFASFAFVIDVDRDIARSASGVLVAAIGVTLLVPQMQGVFARPDAGGARDRHADDESFHEANRAVRPRGTAWCGLDSVHRPDACGGGDPRSAQRDRDPRRRRHADVRDRRRCPGADLRLRLTSYSRGSGPQASPRCHDREARDGVALLVIGALTVSGTDRMVETWLVDRMPEWLVALTTRF
jgi:hypothetical protein